ncbi:3-oxoadipate enol-lactonase [Sulfitobacter pacificus]|jgi:3-oxoadipate enol-lactonase|uniref:3-oxoadipate enol-lactonase n=1 Tax=Sulfitobacter pacificus TaxID=1499314 RepID=A0ABQ5VPL1_9RHOB|nr:3-oxoadipate enol-lactonase [Sulfitobacter pacificus]GLQ29125.1 3-oxoadipate enol-lactonase [Sulfitobacter pacificus]
MSDFLTIQGRVHHFDLRPGTARVPIVFVNSLGTDLRIWDRVIAALPAEWTVLTYDKSGHGLSQGGARTMEEFASDLAALMEANSLEGAMVCGVSVGGMIAQALAASRSDLVAGLVLCNTAHRIGTPESWEERIAALDTTGLEAMADGIIERWFSPTFRRDHPQATAGYRMMLARTPLAGYRAVCAAIRDADLTEATQRLTCPTLCVAGTDDRATPPDLVQALSQLIPTAGFTCYDNVGHLPCIEAPDRLARDIQTHMAALP